MYQVRPEVEPVVSTVKAKRIRIAGVYRRAVTFPFTRRVGPVDWIVMRVSIPVEALWIPWVARSWVRCHKPAELRGVIALVGIIEPDAGIRWITGETLIRLRGASIFAIREEAIRTGLDRRAVAVLYLIDAFGSEINLWGRRWICKHIGLARETERGCAQRVRAQELPVRSLEEHLLPGYVAVVRIERRLPDPLVPRIVGVITRLWSPAATLGIITSAWYRPKNPGVRRTATVAATPPMVAL